MSQVSISAKEVQAMGGLSALARKLEGQAALAEAEASAPKRRRAAPGSRAAQERQARQKAPAPATPSEHDEQVRFFALCRAHEGEYPALAHIYAVPNGGYRHKKTAAYMKAEGQRAGVFDIDLPVARRGWHGWKLELKRKGGVISENQWRFYAAMTAQGYKCCFAWSADEAWAQLMEYLKGGRA